MNETLLKSLVSRPAEDNYQYAGNYDKLDNVKNLLIEKACINDVATVATTRFVPTGNVGYWLFAICQLFWLGVISADFLDILRWNIFYLRQG